MSKFTEDMTDYIVHDVLNDKGYIVGKKIIGKLSDQYIPIDWLQTKGMQLVSNDDRPEIFKLIRAYQKESEADNDR